MSYSNLVYLTEHSEPKIASSHAVTRVDQLCIKAAAAPHGMSWFIDRKPVYQRLISNLIAQQMDVIATLKKEVILIIGSKVRTDLNDRTPEALFHGVIEIDARTALSYKEILGITKEEHPEDFVIGGHVNHESKTIALYRGDFSSILIPFDRFEKNATSEPDFSKLKISDHGMALQLGEYEASVYPILYELDPNYRRRVNKQRKSEDKTFGACLFRARKIMGLNQDDFPGVRRETILRIENQKSKAVRSSTKKSILKKLKLKEEELLNY